MALVNPSSSSAEAARQSRSPGGRPIEPLDPALTTIQPGGGWVMSLELAWGRLRRRWLRTLFRHHVDRMRRLRQGTQGGCPFDPVDPRDIKYYVNQSTYRWAAADDPFAWRSRLPFIRAGLAELLLIGGGLLLAAVFLAAWWWPLAVPFLVAAALVAWFFRNPRRAIPVESGLVVAPADGKVVSIRQFDDPELGRAVEIGIFLSIFNVHVNRASVAGQVLGIRYRPGKFLNALRPESSRENESLEIRIEEPEPPYRVLRIRQITGAIARRIVCWAAPGDRLERGEIYGMIKLGSRTELTLPWEAGLELCVAEQQMVKAGSTVLARYGKA
jgi:phosphatidylserine decarboxylase